MALIWMVEENKDVPEGFGYAVADKVAFFYANNRLVAYTHPVWLQWEFDPPIGLFERVTK